MPPTRYVTRLSNRDPNGTEQQNSVACHVHSDWSYDGKWSLAELAREFGRRGYRAVLMTEHDRGFSPGKWFDYQAACAAASSSDALLVPGIGYSDPTNVLHVLVWGGSSFFGEGLSTGALLSRVRENNANAVLAHPSRLEAWRRFDPSWAADLLGIELWNRKTDGWAPSRPASKLLLATGVRPFVGLDFHTSNQFFPMAMRLPLGKVLSAELVMNSLRKKEFFATVFGRPMLSPAQGIQVPGLEVAEFFRRRAASVLRSWRRK